MSIYRKYILTSLIMALAFPFSPTNAVAGESTMAKGSLSVEGPDAPLSVTLRHAYYVTGRDRFDETKNARSIVFTADDQRAAINACADLQCAMLSSTDGLKVDLAESGSVDWWAHVYPMQYSGTASASELKLSVDNAGRVAGTFSLVGSGATTAIVFDASLIRDFASGK